MQNQEFAELILASASGRNHSPLPNMHVSTGKPEQWIGHAAGRRGSTRIQAMERDLGTAWRPIGELLKLVFVLVIIAGSGFMIFASDGAMPMIAKASSAVAWAERMDSLELRGSLAGEAGTASAQPPSNDGRADAMTSGGNTVKAEMAALAGPMRTGLILAHLLGLVLGVGSTILMDLYFLRHLRRIPLDDTALALIHLGSRLVVSGLILLWLSGIGFLLLYYHTDPGKLANPKMWAKITVVAMLTINGWFIHHRTIPALQARTGGTILRDGRLETLLFFLVPGAISFSGWGFATVLGTVRELNFVAPAETLLLAFLLLLSAVMAATFAGLAMTRRPGDPRLTL